MNEKTSREEPVVADATESEIKTRRAVESLKTFLSEARGVTVGGGEEVLAALTDEERTLLAALGSQAEKMNRVNAAVKADQAKARK